MKKFFVMAVMALVSIAYAAAQPRAIGANLGYGVAVSYQHNLGEQNMLDIALEAPGFGGLGASCTYDWINPFNTQIPWDEKGEWNWFLGVGGGLGWYAPSMGYAGVVGHVGVAYDFWFPLELSFDWRPNIGAWFGQGAAGFNGLGLYSGVTLGVRYKF